MSDTTYILSTILIVVVVILVTAVIVGTICNYMSYDRRNNEMDQIENIILYRPHE